jgi:hypothetical protein
MRKTSESGDPGPSGSKDRKKGADLIEQIDDHNWLCLGLSKRSLWILPWLDLEA